MEILSVVRELRTYEELCLYYVVFIFPFFQWGGNFGATNFVGPNHMISSQSVEHVRKLEIIGTFWDNLIWYGKRKIIKNRFMLNSHPFLVILGMLYGLPHLVPWHPGVAESVWSGDRGSYPYGWPYPIPSGKHTRNYWISLLLIGKSTITGLFSIAMLNYQRVWCFIEQFIYL